MPELGSKNIELYTELKSQLKEKNKLTDEKALELAEKYGEEFIGQGQECLVFTHDGKESDMVITFSYREIDANEIKKTFYLQRFFSTLFPYNFPHFSFVSATKGDERAVTIREKVKPAKDQSTVDLRHPFSEVYKQCEVLGIKFMFDEFDEKNWLISEVGDEYYVDSLKSANFSEWDESKIVSYLENQGSSETEINRAKSVLKILKRFPDTYYEDQRAKEDFLKQIP